MKPGASQDKTALFQKIEQLSRTQKILIYVVCILVAAAAFGYLSYYSSWQAIDRLSTEEGQLQKQLVRAKINAQQIKVYRELIKKAEASFKMAMRALPEKQEIPTLLAGISRAGQRAGLEFTLFQPKEEIPQEFYAELPLAIKVTGDYHQVATFFDKVSRLDRIVNIQDITMAPIDQKARGKKSKSPSSQSAGELETVCTAVTYKFIEKPEQKETDKKSKNKKKSKKKK